MYTKIKYALYGKHVTLQIEIKANLTIVMVVTHKTHFQGSDLILTYLFHTELYDMYSSSFQYLVISAPNIVQRRGMKDETNARQEHV